jgi:hypothetical protein
MVISHSYVSLPEGKTGGCLPSKVRMNHEHIMKAEIHHQNDKMYQN